MENGPWTVVLRSGAQPLVIHNPHTGQMRTLRAGRSQDEVWSSVNYFRLLWDMNSRRALPPSLSSFVMNGYFEKFFTNRRLIGRGGSGSVYHVDHVLAGIHVAEYAVKIVPVGEFTWLRKAVTEVQLLERLSAEPHPLILGYRHCWIEDYQTAFIGPKIPCLFILMEYAKLGNLEGFVSEHPNMTKNQKWFIFLSIAVALSHLHRHGILHRDLKMSNILIFPDSDNRVIPFRFVLSDFGTSVDVDLVSKPWKRTGTTGTIETMAPELIEQSNSGDYICAHSFASDVWSLGVILFTLFFGVNPFVGERGEERLTNYTDFDTLISSLELDSSTVDQLAINMIRRMMKRNPKNRLTLDDFFSNHEIYSKLREFKFERFEPRRDPFAHTFPSKEDIADSILLPLTYEMTPVEKAKDFVLRNKYHVFLCLASAAVSFKSSVHRWIHLLLCLTIITIGLRYSDALYLLTAVIFGEFLFTEAVPLGLTMLIAALVLAVVRR